MAKKTWMFELDDREHTVELEHGFLSGRRIIRIDGNLFEKSTKLFDTGSQHSFQIGGHRCVVHIRTNGFTFNYDLSIDGRSVETGQQVQQSQPIPTWAWLFVVACGIIPIISLGGAIPAAIGAGGAYGCVAIARDPSRTVEMRVGMCVGVTVLCWVLFFLTALGTATICGS